MKERERESETERKRAREEIGVDRAKIRISYKRLI